MLVKMIVMVHYTLLNEQNYRQVTYRLKKLGATVPDKIHQIHLVSKNAYTVTTTMDGRSQGCSDKKLYITCEAAI